MQKFVEVFLRLTFQIVSIHESKTNTMGVQFINEQ